jgi:ectoine hydroxylase-related dioxygenase (phytanoyl-CoA dioxygenase family)
VDFSAAAKDWRRDGYVLLESLLTRSLLDAAVAEIPQVFPSAEEYHSGPLSESNQRFTGDEFGGIVAFPFPSVALCNLVVCDPLVRLAEACLDTEDIRVYASELWAKYTGATTYEQEHHRDYLNHTPLAPSSDTRWRGVEMFIWLCDVPESLGPTRIVPLSVSGTVPALPHTYSRSGRPDFYESEVSSAGGPGTVVAYSTETFHRGTELTRPTSARFSAHVSYRRADAPWLDRHAWGDRSFLPAWNPFIEQASARQLLLFGVPPPGHPYWTSETLEGMKVRYPGLDLSSWANRGQ